MTRRLSTMLAIVVALSGAHAAPRQPEIGIVINGEPLAVQPPPLLERGILMVPVRRTIVALGLAFTARGSRMFTAVGAKRIVLRDGSRVALVNGTPFYLDAPAVRRNGVFYAPLRFFTAVLGAEATFDRRAHVVTIIAQLLGRSGEGDFTIGNRTVRVGTVTAVDVDSDPPTVTLAFNGDVHTIAISNNAIISMRDVGVDVQVNGELADVRPGDYAEVVMRRNGTVTSVIDEYGSRYGRIAVAAPNELLMQDGHVIVPDRDTVITLNGKTAAFPDLQAGDRATVRYNVETGEVREIVAERADAQYSAQSGTASITSVSIDATHALRAGDTVTVTMLGTPGGAATFDVGAYVRGIAMTQKSPGTYTGRYTIERSAAFVDTPIVAHLRMSDGSSVAARAVTTLSASGQPPGIVAVGPSDGASVDLNMPAVYATFVTEAVPVNPSSIRLEVDGRDVTPECLRTTHFVQYIAERKYRRGPMHVTVRVSDEAGNTTVKSWTFYIRRGR